MYSDARDLHLMVELTVCCLSLIDGDIDIGESLSKNIPSFSSRWSIDNEAILRFYCSIFFFAFYNSTAFWRKNMYWPKLSVKCYMSIVSSLFQEILHDYSHSSVYGDQDSEVFQVLTEREILVLSCHSACPAQGRRTWRDPINKQTFFIFEDCKSREGK